MQVKTGLERVWAACDTLLLVSVFILLVVVWNSNRRDSPDQATPQKREASLRSFQRPPSAGQPIEGMRVSLERRRVNTIARSMVDSGWDQSRTCPAMDMREDGKNCEVFFTLPEGIAEDSVRVSAAGGVVTLTMRDDDSGRSYMQRIRIPFGVERSDTVETVISNDVLRIRICPCATKR